MGVATAAFGATTSGACVAAGLEPGDVATDSTAPATCNPVVAVASAVVDTDGLDDGCEVAGVALGTNVIRYSTNSKIAMVTAIGTHPNTSVSLGRVLKFISSKYNKPCGTASFGRFGTIRRATIREDRRQGDE